MTDFAVRLLKLSKSFAGQPAVSRVSLDVPRGQILAVLGPSGCGKTTLLRLIAGFETPDEGEVYVNGDRVAGPDTFVPPEARRVGMVFQQHALFPHLTVEENIAFGLSGKTKSEREERVQHLLNLIRLPQAHNRYPSELSGGQRQRVAVARALSPQPVTILMDEPFSNLDADQRLKIRDEVRFILKQAQTTVVFVTHDQEEALFMGDSLAVMRDGELQQQGQPEAVFRSPASNFIAEFLGHAEFIPATVADARLETEIGNLPQKVDLPAGDTVEIGFRADDLNFAPDRNGEAMILARFFQGAMNLYRIRLKSGRIVHSLQPHYRNFPSGAPVRVWFEPHHALPCFKDGQAIESDLTPASPQ